ncbi:hypothetical protein M409DRAFT_21849 [Zasmidium cellare ATCC 36951]|uniref:Uncharacterized protein n=1 Tax=Zasmidium cellare ATCC 36951 TaxID=1080233 RepID=A0A6A6CQF5_ZASCE|nr:uncharacterized protein M409DRAFT_21849 [Zasmidium cellare ATCC 36951]KAF2167696.1 hypothetical protein M409DRAFT_21849 [Zasmidium cellare ATCC 36951]
MTDLVTYVTHLASFAGCSYFNIVSVKPKVLNTLLLPREDVFTMPALLTSHEELRTRMEATGISEDQIATVLKGLNPPPGEADANPPPYDQQDRFGKRGAPAPLQLAEIPTFEALHHRGRQTTFKVHFVTSADNKKTCQKIVLDGLPKSQAAWTVDFLQKTGFSKEPNLRMFRQTDNGERGHQICECVFHHRVNQNVEIKHPWYTWEGWNPNTEVWSSDTGFLDETWMKWHYDLSDPRYPDRAVVVCKTVEKVGKHRTTNEPAVLEVCRVILNNDVTPAVIELPEEPWKHATEEQMDEMMSNAMINYWRRQMGWWTKPSSGGGSRSTDTSGIASVTASVSSVC